ncbi:MAG TPA: hypothetical protein VE974_05815 [Thermoanaerobaculia bacterium]|nr:hypothetical protein [Thermoanaerobaculia bacterium]
MRTKCISLLASILTVLALPALANVKFHNNSVKYKDTSRKAATGRSGSATLQARALVNQDRTADLQLTTGTFEPVASRGNIDKVQIKSQSTGTINDNRLRNNGTYAVTLKSVNRGQAIDVLAHVSGIDGRRTDIVSVSETAKLRPDLHVTAINAPGTAIVGSPALISASVRELNGDVGARADCTLRVNGAVIGSAPRIWVNAGGAVSCSFLHTFNTAGNAAIEVLLRNVDPGDYDNSNNALQGSVKVAAHELGMQRWSASSGETEVRSRSVSEASWGYRSESSNTGWENYTGFSSIWEENLDLSTLEVTYVEKIDNTTVVNLRNMPLKRDDKVFQGNGAGQCMVGVTELVSAVICQRAAQTTSFPPRPKYINPMFERRAGDVTYFWGEWGLDGLGGKYVNNVDSGRKVYGNQTRLGATVSLEVVVGDATRTYAERPSYATAHIRTQESNTPWRCWNSYWCGENTFYRADWGGFATSPGY